MEGLPLDAEVKDVVGGELPLGEPEVDGFVDTVEFVADQRESAGQERRAYLMKFPADGVDVKQGQLGRVAVHEGGKIGDDGAVGIETELLLFSDFRMGLKERAASRLRGGDSAFDRGQVVFFDALCGKLAPQVFAGLCRLGDQDDARGFAVEAVDELGGRDTLVLE